MTNRFLLPLTLAAALVGCNTDEPTPPAAQDDIHLRRMADCDELRDRLTDTLTDSVLGLGRGFYPPMAEDDMAADGGSESGGGAPTDFTGTNNQEAGVDELDLVKTNGTHMFIAQDRSLQILRSWPAADSAVIASIALDGWARGLFLVGEDKAVVLEDVSGYVDIGDQWWSALRAKVIDISDPANPTVLHTIDLQGWLTDARMIEGQVFLVVNQYMDFPSEVWEAAYQASATLPWPADGDQAVWEAARASNRAMLRPLIAGILSTVDLDTVLPGYRADAAAEFESLYACSDIYTPSALSQMAMLSVAKLDPDAGTLSATGLMSDGWTIYASPTALYVAQTSAWWWGWTGEEGKSNIHRFDLSGDTPAYTGSGQVTGWLYDQFAMSEYEGDLRVVTTDFGWWGWGGGDVAVSDGGVSVGGDEGSGGGEAPPSTGGGGDDAPPDEPVGDTDVPEDEPVEEPPTTDPAQPANHVFVLRAEPTGDLGVIGHIGNIAPGETVQSVRMMGEKGYVITFRQTDPLFTLDLSNPTAPQLVGELHMPGYSAYLHPLDDDHLIGVGMAGLETGELTGLAINLFDVSDLANPQLIDQFEIDSGDNGWSWSEAMWDHHAFTFHRDVLTIPAFTYSWDETTGVYDGFSGTISFKITAAEGIEELGRVDHRALIDSSECIWDILWAEDEKDPREDGVDPGEPSGDTDDDVVVDPPPDDGGGEDPSEEPGEEPGGEPGSEEPIEEGEWSYCDWDYGYWYAQVRRSVYIEDNLYTISNYGVRVNDLNDPSISIADVLFFPAATPE
jgi:uncharacterized secreted protein with C-terminal beta-propeller domain